MSTALAQPRVPLDRDAPHWLAVPCLKMDVVVTETRANVRVEGEVDLVTAPVLGAMLGAIVDRGARHVELDFGKVTFFSVIGWRVVADVVGRLERIGGGVDVVAASVGTRRIFELCDRAASDSARLQVWCRNP